MKTVIGLGDLLVSLSPENNKRFLQAEAFQINYTGAEANVCVSLSQLGMKTQLLTKLPDNPIGQCALSWMKRFGVGTDYIAFGKERIGLLYLERGASQRPSQVIYDRQNTAFCNAVEADYNFDLIFANADWFHFTGITPALSDKTAALTEAACKTAKKHGIQISCDLNYRRKLWSEQRANKVMSRLLQYVDVLIANEEDVERVLGIKAANTDVNKGILDTEGYVEVAKQIRKQYGISIIATTLRESHSASNNGWSAILYDADKVYLSKKYEITIVDRVGSGDSFSAGIIYGLLNGYEDQATLEFATAASCLKHSIELDFNLSSVEEIENLMNGNASGRVQR